MMKHCTVVLFLAGVLCVPFFAAHAQQAPPSTVQMHDPRHDFDWDIGDWNVHQRRLLHPLSGSKSWVEYDGTDVVRNIWDGANEGIVKSDGPAGHLEIYTVRLYDPDEQHWKIYFANRAGGAMSSPVVGGFNAGSAEFFDHETYKGKPIMLRFRVSDIKANSCRFDQSFSPDDGKTWEVNFIVTENREARK